eukprot:TRINITY_DN2121_c0_g2_i3.p1 TRINITY_DN2121_c0_g2~~TRINITY_DN2121_c0_g2_i3.p1  ORF type:complete len:269 (+),score=6.45 TRINITY_DN2121_c0_g2_i3:998-1804(+)
MRKEYIQFIEQTTKDKSPGRWPLGTSHRVGGPKAMGADRARTGVVSRCRWALQAASPPSTCRPTWCMPATYCPRPGPALRTYTEATGSSFTQAFGREGFQETLTICTVTRDGTRSTARSVSRISSLSSVSTRARSAATFRTSRTNRNSNCAALGNVISVDAPKVTLYTKKPTRSRLTSNAAEKDPSSREGTCRYCKDTNGSPAVDANAHLPDVPQVAEPSDARQEAPRRLMKTRLFSMSVLARTPCMATSAGPPPTVPTSTSRRYSLS